jgi:hypothetical protein
MYRIMKMIPTSARTTKNVSSSAVEVSGRDFTVGAGVAPIGVAVAAGAADGATVAAGVAVGAGVMVTVGADGVCVG